MMYEENARNINAILAMVNSAAKHDVIGLGQPDSMLKAREYLDQGCMIGMLADRTLSGENGESLVRLDFLGASAGFPLGPLRMAAMLRRPAIFMTGLYRGDNRYDVHFEALADFSAESSGDRTVQVRSALERYVGLVEKYCRAAPYNWFNYFDFWHENALGAAHDEGGCDKARSASGPPIVRNPDV
jgi:predicted LPLAT superfamily acyltransferase